MTQVSFRFLIALFFASSFGPWTVIRAESGDLYERAQEEFSKRQYPKALESFRSYLRARPGDQDAWTRFAAAYYHTGQPEQALAYLRRTKVSSELRAFNLYYQGLCHDALGNSQKARKILARVSRMEDPLADDALFEKAAIEFDENDSGAAKVSAEEYKRRFRNGRYRPSVDFMLQRLGQGGKVEVSEAQRTLYKKSFFENNPLSLMPLPHAWLYRIGYDWEGGERISPTSDPNQEPKAKPYSSQKLVAKAGLNLGPFRWQSSKHTIGYLYSQDWLSDSDRLNVYADDPTDFEYFPFRPDLMERSNRFFFESSYAFGPFEVGTYAHFEFLKGGSSLYPAPERKEIRRVYDIGTSTTFIPWVEWQYAPQHKLRASVYFDKFLDAAQSDFSYKTYNISGGLTDGTIPSVSLENESSFPDLHLTARAEVFRWTYIYNDYWEGYVTNGASLWLTGEPLFSKGWPIFLSGRMTLAQRDYTSALIKSTPCAGGEGSPTTCPRSEFYLKFGASLSYIRDKQQAFSVFFDYRSLENATLKVYNESSYDFLFAVTHAFPSLESGGRYIEPPRGLHLTRGIY